MCADHQQFTLAQDQPFAFAQAIHGVRDPPFELHLVMGLAHHLRRGLTVIGQGVDPFAAFILARLLRIERKIRPRQAPVHHIDITQRHTKLHRDFLVQLVAIKALTLGGRLALEPRLNAAHIEKQRLL